ncbi:MAG: hypothetical protein ABIG66_02625 [Candidatus Kerfeldbacteria bacterium]
MQYAGLPIIEQAQASSTLVTGIAYLIGIILYYGLIIPIGILATLIAYIMEVMINYPHGDFWGGGGGYVNVTAVVTGWKLVRDVCNIFFSLILVIIAIGTTLHIEQYNWKQLLPKFVLMAVLINFSKSICGIFTDLATVAMATFGGSFAGKFGKGILGAFGLPGISDINSGETSDISEGSNAGSILLAYIAAAVMVMVMFVIMCVFTATLIFRIIMLWFLIVLSPLAYITRILPMTAKHSTKWWEMFGRYCLVGPLVTFFLWLSLSLAFGTSVGTTTGQDTTGGNPVSNYVSSEDFTKTTADLGTPPQAGSFKSSSPNALANFMLAIMMLMASLKMIQDMAAEFGKFTGAIEGAMWSAGTSVLEKPGQWMTAAGQKWGNIGAGEGASTGAKIGGAVAKMAGFAGATAFSPIQVGKNAYAGLTKSSAEKKAQAAKQAQNLVDGMREDDAMSRDKSGKLNVGKSIIGLARKAAGFTGGLGTQASKQNWDAVSGQGGYDLAETLVQAGKGEFKKEAELKNSQAALGKAKDEELEKVSEEEKTELEGDIASATEAAKKLGTDQQAAAAAATKDTGNFEVDLTIPEVRAAVEAEIKTKEDRQQQLNSQGLSVEADKLKPAIDALKDGLKNNKLNVGGAGALKDKETRERIAGSYKDAQEKFEAQAAAAKERIDKGVTTKAKQEEAVKKFNAVDTELRTLQVKLGSLGIGRNTEARIMENAAVAEEMKKIADVKDSEELRGYSDRALRTGNLAMVKACDMRIAQNCDENERFGPWMAEFKGQTKYKDPFTGKPLEPNSGYEGMELYRRAILMDKLGMSEQDSMRHMSDISYIGENSGHPGVARAYGVQAGKLVLLSDKQRSKIISNEMSKRDIYSVYKLNRLGFVKEDEAGNVEELLGEGVDMLKQFGPSFETEQHFNKMTANARKVLSRPPVRQMLLKAGVSPKFVKLLADYRTNARLLDTD